MKKRKIYIAGPMTGYEDFNYNAFKQVEVELSFMHFEPVNPHHVGTEPFDVIGKTGDEPITQEQLKTIVADDLRALQGCECLYMLKGWEKSTGARAEHAVGVWLGLEIWYE